jgi:hypothetical protein
MHNLLTFLVVILVVIFMIEPLTRGVKAGEYQRAWLIV